MLMPPPRVQLIHYPVKVVSIVVAHVQAFNPVEVRMRTTLETLVSVTALTVLAVSLQAALLPPNKGTAAELGDTPIIELLRQGCGWGWYRARWVDHWGYVHWGRCVPIK
jgi:hypothetical protein